jgi:hypothetical protein
LLILIEDLLFRWFVQTRDLNIVVRTDPLAYLASRDSSFGVTSCLTRRLRTEHLGDPLADLEDPIDGRQWLRDVPRREAFRVCDHGVAGRNSPSNSGQFCGSGIQYGYF